MPQSLAASSVDCLTRINHAGRTDPEAEKPGHASAMELHHSSVCESRSDYACHGDTRLDTIETKQAGPVIVNPIPQPLRRRVILEMLSRVEGAFSGREAPAASPDSISITGSLDYPPRAATTPLVRPLAHPDPCTTRSMSTALSTSTQTCDAEAYLDGNDRQNPSSGAYCDHQPFRSGAQGSAGRPPSQEAAASQEEQHPDQAVRSNRKRKMSSRAKESRPYPCVYHTNGSHEDPTSHCRMHQRCVSLLRYVRYIGTHNVFHDRLHSASGTITTVGSTVFSTAQSASPPSTQKKKEIRTSKTSKTRALSSASLTVALTSALIQGSPADMAEEAAKVTDSSTYGGSCSGLHGRTTLSRAWR